MAALCHFMFLLYWCAFYSLVCMHIMLPFGAVKVIDCYPPVASRNCCRGDQRIASTDFSWPRSMWVVEPDFKSMRWTRDSPHATATSPCWVATGDISWQKTKLLILKSFTVCTHRARLVLGLVIDLWRVYHPGIYLAHSSPLSLAIPLWVGAMSTGDGFGQLWEETAPLKLRPYGTL